MRKHITQVLKLIGQYHSLVVSTGGGVVLQTENWGILHQGIVIWLNPSRDLILQRLTTDNENRPLIESSNPAKNFDKLLSERKKLYEQADVHVNINDESSTLTIKRVLENLSSLLKDQGHPIAQQTIEE